VYSSLCCIALEMKIFDDVGSDLGMIFDDEEFHRGRIEG
jgi:hypothetical protein